MTELVTLRIQESSCEGRRESSMLERMRRRTGLHAENNVFSNDANWRKITSIPTRIAIHRSSSLWNKLLQSENLPPCSGILTAIPNLEAENVQRQSPQSAMDRTFRRHFGDLWHFLSCNCQCSATRSTRGHTNTHLQPQEQRKKLIGTAVPIDYATDCSPSKTFAFSHCMFVLVQCKARSTERGNKQRRQKAHQTGTILLSTWYGVDTKY